MEWDRPGQRASGTRHLCNLGGFSGFFFLLRSWPMWEGRGCVRVSPGGQGVPYLLFVALVLLVDAICRTGIADGLLKSAGQGPREGHQAAGVSQDPRRPRLSGQGCSPSSV